jgi:glycosyltransferase involved in cell wall biosynthesis
VTASVPLLSIITPVFDAAATLPRTLRSLERIAPEHRDRIEVIAVNDGSTDDSLAILHDAERGAGGFAFRVLDQANGGAASARNAALQVAAGEWIFFLDADDELRFDPVSIATGARQETSFGFSVEYRRDGTLLSRVRPKLVTQSCWADVLTARNPFQPSSLLFRRACIDRPFQEGIACVEDWLFWMTNTRIFERMRPLPAVTAAFIHLHGRNISAQFARAGANRVRAVEIVESLYQAQLTRRHRNNLTIQKTIGKLQQGMSVPLACFLRFPCDPLLYGKLWVYYVAGLLRQRATPYREGPVPA